MEINQYLLVEDFACESAGFCDAWHSLASHGTYWLHSVLHHTLTILILIKEGEGVSLVQPSNSQTSLDPII